jgi:ubiquinone/menaquinone biosynthesis C-methylase UbiE
MSMQTEVKQQVREFYDQIGWQQVSEGLYQNAHYEDLRPVAREYIHRCHLRVLRHLKPHGEYLLDAGSGPIQYPEYLEYSRGYRRRVCADISIVALQEARQRVGEHGMFVVADIANLPFKSGCFDGIVSLHTIHHLPEEEHLSAYRALQRVLATDGTGVVVNGWPGSRLMSLFNPLMRASTRARNLVRRLMRRPSDIRQNNGKQEKSPKKKKAKGTFTNRHDHAWVKEQVGAEMDVEILVWRSVSVKFLRTMIHSWNGGRYWLRLLFWLEERFPNWFGEVGQYPLIVIRPAWQPKHSPRRRKA